MVINTGREPLQTPERLDVRFGVVAGGYVATLLSPILLLIVVERLQLSNELLALGLLGAVGTVLTAVVAWHVTRWGGLVAWFNASWLPWLIPVVGVLPMVANLVHVILFIGYAVSDLQPETATSLIGVAGFISGIVAWCLGATLVFMARNRLANAATADRNVDIEWTAGWTRSKRFKYMLGVLVIGGVLLGLIFMLFDLTMVVFTMPLIIALITAINNFSSERTYRVTAVGLERHLELRGPDSHLFTPWIQFEGFTVTERAIVLHRRRFRPDVRFPRWHLMTTEREVIAALDAYLDRKNP